jgi:hypothetical protein
VRLSNRETAVAGSCQPTLIIQRQILTDPLQAYNEETHVHPLVYYSAIFIFLSHMKVMCGMLHWRPVYLFIFIAYLWSRDSSVGIAAVYGLDVRVSIPGRGKRFFVTPKLPDRLWCPPGLLYNVCRMLFPRRWSGKEVKLTTYLDLVPRSRMVELYLQSPIRLRGAVLNEISTGTTFLVYLWFN